MPATGSRPEIVAAADGPGVPARITRSARHTYLCIAVTWPCAQHLVTAFGRLTALPMRSADRQQHLINS